MVPGLLILGPTTLATGGHYRAPRPRGHVGAETGCAVRQGLVSCPSLMSPGKYHVGAGPEIAAVGGMESEERALSLWPPGKVPVLVQAISLKFQPGQGLLTREAGLPSCVRSRAGQGHPQDLEQGPLLLVIYRHRDEDRAANQALHSRLTRHPGSPRSHHIPPPIPSHKPPLTASQDSPVPLPCCFPNRGPPPFLPLYLYFTLDSASGGAPNPSPSSLLVQPTAARQRPPTPFPGGPLPVGEMAQGVCRDRAGPAPPAATSALFWGHIQPQLSLISGAHSASVVPADLEGSWSRHPYLCANKSIRRSSLGHSNWHLSATVPRRGDSQGPGVPGTTALRKTEAWPQGPHHIALTPRLLVLSPQAPAGNGAHASWSPGSPLGPRAAPGTWEVWTPRSSGGGWLPGRGGGGGGWCWPGCLSPRWEVGAEPVVEGEAHVRHSFALFSPPFCPRP